MDNIIVKYDSRIFEQKFFYRKTLKIIDPLFKKNFFVSIEHKLFYVKLFFNKTQRFNVFMASK